MPWTLNSGASGQTNVSVKHSKYVADKRRWDFTTLHRVISKTSGSQSVMHGSQGIRGMIPGDP